MGNFETPWEYKILKSDGIFIFPWENKTSIEIKK